MPGSMPAWLGGAPREAPIEDRSPQQIYLGAEALLDGGDPREAGQQFSEVERLYPYSDWAKRATPSPSFSIPRPIPRPSTPVRPPARWS